MYFLDTNIFIRHVTNDHPDHSERALRVFERLQSSEDIATTSEAVLLEIVQVLSSRIYEVGRVDIAQAIIPLLLLPGLQLAHRNTWVNALTLYRDNNVDFADCLSVAQMQELGLTEVMSFDKHFDRFPGIERIEP